jgi:hypothetical protein
VGAEVSRLSLDIKMCCTNLATFFLEHVDQRNLYKTHECYSYFTLKIGLRAAASANLMEVSLCFCTYVPIGLHKYSYFSSVCMIQDNQKVSVQLTIVL